MSQDEFLVVSMTFVISEISPHLHCFSDCCSHITREKWLNTYRKYRITQLKSNDIVINLHIMIGSHLFIQVTLITQPVDFEIHIATEFVRIVDKAAKH